MHIIETIILGIVQGLTEFLPISSSGQLVIFQNILGFEKPELLLGCALHLGTLLAVCLHLRVREKITSLFRSLLLYDGSNRCSICLAGGLEWNIK
jgi:undecaprenyl pyrophosphate phosphatase UppP